MAVITMRVDDEIKKKMEELKDVNWSEVARKAIVDKIRETELWQHVDVALLHQASSDTDALRRIAKGWDSVGEIRKWRERDQKQH